MKKIVASMGLLALGLTSVYADPAKPWSVAATLRGFYDDNYNSATKDSEKVSSLGYEISPQAAIHWGNDQTTIFGSYAYSLKWYEQQGSSTSSYDQQHVFVAGIDHVFDQITRISATDSLAVGQEPDTLRAG